MGQPLAINHFISSGKSAKVNTLLLLILVFSLGCTSDEGNNAIKQSETEIIDSYSLGILLAIEGIKIHEEYDANKLSLVQLENKISDVGKQYLNRKYKVVGTLTEATYTYPGKEKISFHIKLFEKNQTQDKINEFFDENIGLNEYRHKVILLEEYGFGDVSAGHTWGTDVNASEYNSFFDNAHIGDSIEVILRLKKVNCNILGGGAAPEFPGVCWISRFEIISINKANT